MLLPPSKFRWKLIKSSFGGPPKQKNRTNYVFQGCDKSLNQCEELHRNQKFKKRVFQPRVIEVWDSQYHPIQTRYDDLVVFPLCKLVVFGPHETLLDKLLFSFWWTVSYGRGLYSLLPCDLSCEVFRQRSHSGSSKQHISGSCWDHSSSPRFFGPKWGCLIWSVWTVYCARFAFRDQKTRWLLLRRCWNWSWILVWANALPSWIVWGGCCLFVFSNILVPSTPSMLKMSLNGRTLHSKGLSNTLVIVGIRGLRCVIENWMPSLTR